MAGFVEGSKGCCGTGTIEYGESCRGMSTCSDPDKYVFWDAVHPTQKMYKIINDETIESITKELISQHSQLNVWWLYVFQRFFLSFYEY